jgi:hypothetical protein
MAISKAQQERLVKAGELLEDAFESIVIMGIDEQDRKGAWLRVRGDATVATAGLDAALALQEATKEAFAQVKKKMRDQ